MKFKNTYQPIPQQSTTLTDRLHVVVEELVEASGAVGAHEVHEVPSAGDRAHRRLGGALHHGLFESLKDVDINDEIFLSSICRRVEKPRCML